MTIEAYIDAIRALAQDEGIAIDASFWLPYLWTTAFENGLSPSDAWDLIQHPALCAL